MHMPVSAKFRKSPVKSRSRDGRGRGELVIITGMSGSGKASVLKAFEDLGYYCVDNLPVGLIPRFAELVGQSSEIERTALVVDVREGTQLDELPAIVKSVKRMLPTKTIFLEARINSSSPLQRDSAAAPAGHGYSGQSITDRGTPPFTADSRYRRLGDRYFPLQRP